MAEALRSFAIAHLAIGGDAPRPHRIVVIEVVFATDGEQLGETRLHIAGFIRRAALDDRRLAVPMPRQAEARQRARQDRRLQLRFLPGLAAVDRDVDPLDLAASAPGDAGDLAK